MSGTIRLSDDHLWSSRTVQFRWMLEHASRRLADSPDIVRILEGASAVQGLNLPSQDVSFRKPILAALLDVAEAMGSGRVSAFPDETDMEAIYQRKARELADMVREVIASGEAS